MPTLLQIQYFYQLAQTENISQTARSFGISQTALSGMINKMENELGLKLFDRGKNSLHLNDAGRIYLSTAERVVQAMESGRKAVLDLDGSIKDIYLSVGKAYVWRDLLLRFKKMYPAYTVHRLDLSYQDGASRLKRGEIDLLIKGTGFPRDGMEARPLGQDRIYLVIPQSHPLAGRTSVSFQDFREENFIGLSDQTGFARCCKACFEAAGYKPRYTIECDYLLRSSLVQAGAGVALTSSSGKASGLLAPNVHIPISDAFARWQLYLVWNPRLYLSHAATLLRDFLLTELNGKL